MKTVLIVQGMVVPLYLFAGRRLSVLGILTDTFRYRYGIPISGTALVCSAYIINVLAVSDESLTALAAFARFCSMVTVILLLNVGAYSYWQPRLPK